MFKIDLIDFSGQAIVNKLMDRVSSLVPHVIEWV